MKRGQVTIFVVAGILVVFGVGLYFALHMSSSSSNVDFGNPKDSVLLCIEEPIRQAILELLEKGGVENPQLRIAYKGINYTYLCHSAEYFQKCINRYPFFFEDFEESINEKSKIIIKECFDKTKNEYKKIGYDVDGNFRGSSLEIIPGSLRVKINATLNLTRGDSSIFLENMDFEIPSPVYKILNLVLRIINSEADLCDFLHGDYMILNPDILIRRIYYKGSKLYEITDKKSDYKIKFAVRGCVRNIWS
ncbi:hypothetical protein D6829_00370 [Candidatus Pacearchaeota archaeon]|nr:MAG: hypothetical protein D6829_00370 [Candidatus Pacearchaeota archaeon]